MTKKNKILSFAFFFLLGTFFFSSVANAYIDPSAMTYMVQVIAGIVIASGAAVGFFFKKLKRNLKKGKSNQPAQKHTVQGAVKFANDDEFDDSKLTRDELDTLNGKKRI